MRNKPLDENYEGPKQERMIDGIRRNAYVMNVDNRDYECPINMGRFLKSNVGRPWRKVYSELCEKFSSEKDRQHPLPSEASMQSQSREHDCACPDCLVCAIIEGLLKLATQFESNELIPVTKTKWEIQDGEIVIVDRREIIIPARQLILPANHHAN